MSFNKVNVGKFFELLERLQDEKKFPASRIYNVDETGLTLVQGIPSKVIAMRGRRQVGCITSAERGKLCTAVICMNASGNFIPPFIIFPRSRMKVELMNGMPPDSTFFCHPTGWMQMEIFVEWFRHFLRHSSASIDNPCLLILDGHSTHTNNLEVIDLSRNHGVTLLCLPPHCSHKLQPLDVAFMKPLSTYYDQECEKWLRQNPGRIITVFQLGEIFGKAYMRSSTVLTAINGFRKTGIFPVNRDVFDESEFSPARTTEQPISEEPSSQGMLDQPTSDKIMESCPSVSDYQISPCSRPNISESSNLCDNNSLQSPCFISNTTGMENYPNLPGERNSSEIIGPFQISPLPLKREQRKRQSNKKGKSAILTSSPYKKELDLRIQCKGKIKKETKKERPKENQELLRKCDKKMKRSQSKNEKSKPAAIGHSTVEDEDDVPCLYCKEFYQESKEPWIQCRSCLLWAHISCAGTDSAAYVCEICN